MRLPRLSGAGKPFLDLVHRHADGAVPATGSYDPLGRSLSDPVSAVSDAERVTATKPMERISLALSHSAEAVFQHLVSHTVNYTVTNAISQLSETREDAPPDPVKNSGTARRARYPRTLALFRRRFFQNESGSSLDVAGGY